MADIDEIAEELYGVPLEDFTAQRNATAKQAKAGGDAELSEQVKALAKPTAAAWLANLLARERPDELEDLALLGEQMREATAALDGAKLRELTPRRHQQVDALVKDAGTLAGRKVSTDVAQKLRETLDAALVDPAAAQAVRSGRLTSALRHVGFGVVDESGEPTNVVALAPRRSVRRGAAAAKTRDEAAEREAAKRVEEARQAAAGRRRRWTQPRHGSTTCVPRSTAWPSGSRPARPRWSGSRPSWSVRGTSSRGRRRTGTGSRATSRTPNGRPGWLTGAARPPRTRWPSSTRADNGCQCSPVASRV